MIYLKARLLERRRIDRLPRQIVDTVHEGMDGDWPGFLSGFITADGSLGLHANGRWVIPVSRVVLRADDAPLLAEFATRTRVGRLLHATATAERSAEASWTVRARDELQRLVEVLDLVPPRGRKAVHYELWREGVQLYSRRPPGYRSALADLQERLAAAKRYQPPR
jgi:hypothetical protein